MVQVDTTNPAFDSIFKLGKVFSNHEEHLLKGGLKSLIIVNVLAGVHLENLLLLFLCSGILLEVKLALELVVQNYLTPLSC